MDHIPSRTAERAFYGNSPRAAECPPDVRRVWASKFSTHLFGSKGPLETVLLRFHLPVVGSSRRSPASRPCAQTRPPGAKRIRPEENVIVCSVRRNPGLRFRPKTMFLNALAPLVQVWLRARR